jgi:molybdate transport system substrate-binding protein
MELVSRSRIPPLGLKTGPAKTILRLLFLFGILAGPVLVSAAELTVAAAADLKFAFDELVTEFQTNQSPIRVKVSYGSSGNFYAQLQNKAPFDLFFSADIDYPRKLAEAGLAYDTNVFLYAVGRVVVWVPNRSSVDVDKLGIQALLAPSVKKIAVANPQHAPYGRAAVAAMKSLGVFQQAEPELVYGENIAQTAQFVQSGAADIGIIALSLAVAPQMRAAGRYWEVPLDIYPKMEQGGIIVQWTREPEAARAFRDFILGKHGREVLKRYGFSLSGE